MPKWEKTIGQITRSEVGVHISSEGDNMDRPIIHWAYKVNGRRYEGQLGDIGYFRAKQLVAKYPVGKQVEVSYNPEKPQISTVAGLEWITNAGRRGGALTFALLILIFGTLIVVSLFIISTGGG
ncbi:DUF3592 domain-containing protein [Aggregatilineales bacterium SYSU G02658]